MSDSRDQFLIAMYNEMWENINRHILVVWQSVAVLGGAFAALMLAEKQTVPLDYSATIVVLVAAWQIAHVVDASWWFSRNLRIVTNIERQFLRPSDEQEIHCFFKKHRDPSMLEHQKIQCAFGLLATTVVLLYHFDERVRPGLSSSIENFESGRALPYVAAIICGGLLYVLHRHARNAYEKLEKDSPGKAKASSETSFDR